MQTKLMNEGAATYCHYRIMTALHADGRISDGAFMEFLQSHTNVVHQPMFDAPGYNGLNPYAVGFAMMNDIALICTQPTDEDREWFPDIAGSTDRSEEHTSELLSLMRISYAVLCLTNNRRSYPYSCPLTDPRRLPIPAFDHQ